MDDAAEYARLTAEIERHREGQQEAARRRAALVRAMLETRTQAAVAELLGVTPGRVGQLARRSD